jgi:hypothetical protein
MCFSLDARQRSAIASVRLLVLLLLLLLFTVVAALGPHCIHDSADVVMLPVHALEM